MPNPPDIQKHVNAQIARLVLELATAHAVIESLEGQRAARAAQGVPERDAVGGSVDGAQGADGPRTE